jgi:hypothetical protein
MGLSGGSNQAQAEPGSEEQHKKCADPEREGRSLPERQRPLWFRGDVGKLANRGLELIRRQGADPVADASGRRDRDSVNEGIGERARRWEATLGIALERAHADLIE